jgi:hypothetical protein
MKTKYFLFFMLLFSFIINANAQYRRRGETLQSPGNKTKSKKADYTIDQFKGKWQEIERIYKVDSSSVSFKDSIQLIFSDSSKVQTRTSTNSPMTMNGEAEIENDNLLTVAADEYTVKSLTATELILDDNDKFIHRLKKVDHFWFETIGKNPAKK